MINRSLRHTWASIRMLEIRDIDVYHGDLQALHKVSLVVKDREIVTIVGSNGAGKKHLTADHMWLAQTRHWQDGVQRV